MKATDHSDQEWYALAEQYYVEKHQGCVWCGGSHRVFCLQKDNTKSYYCQACDCRCTFQSDTGTYQFFPGEDLRDRGPETMNGEGDLHLRN